MAMSKQDIKQYIQDKMTFDNLGLTQYDLKIFVDLLVKANDIQLRAMQEKINEEIERRQAK